MESSQPLSEAQPNEIKKALPSISTLFSEAWSFVLTHKNVTIGYGIPVALLGLATAFITPTGEVDPMLSIAIIVLAVVTFFSTAALLHAVHQTGETIYYIKSLRWGVANIWPLIWTYIVTAVVMLLGYIFFIIPGIIATVFFYFSQYAFYHERVVGTKALRASYRAVKGRWWGIFGKILLMFLIVLGLTILLSIASAVLYVLGDSLLAIIVREGITQFAMGIVGVMSVYTMARFYEQIKPVPATLEPTAEVLTNI